MNILLAFKAEPDLTMLAEKDWLAAEQGSLDIALTRPCFGGDEQAGAEILLRQPSINLTAISVGNGRAEHFLRQLKASGFQHAVSVALEDEACFSPREIAGLLAAWQRQNPQSLIVLGSRSAEGNNGQTGFYLAELLSWPCFSRVCDFELDAEQQLISLEQRVEKGRQHLTVRLPAVVMMESDGRYCLRTPGLRQKLAVKAEDVQTVSAQELDYETPASPRCLRLTRKTQRRAGLIIQGKNAREKAHHLYRDWLRKRMEP